MSSTTRYLNLYYYGVMLLALIVLGGMHLLLMRGAFTPVDVYSSLGQALQYIVIFDMLASVPGALWGFKQLCRPVTLLEDEAEKRRRYRRLAAIRIVLIGQSLLLALLAFYLLGGYRSMMWVAAIGAIAWYFTKPTDRKMEIELQAPLPGQENY